MEIPSGPTPDDPLWREANRINQYGLVSYIAGPLGDFLYDLREEIVPGCRLRTHISILPPRPLEGTQEEAIAMLNMRAHRHHAFTVKLGDIEMFESSHVIYIALAKGASNMKAMYRDLNRGPLSFDEYYPYHPHVTLAQCLPDEKLAWARDLCDKRWNEWQGDRTFEVDRMTFVQNTTDCGWLDLAESKLELASVRS
jgi:2'-5' RNA ligase